MADHSEHADGQRPETNVADQQPPAVEPSGAAVGLLGRAPSADGVVAGSEVASGGEPRPAANEANGSGASQSRESVLDVAAPPPRKRASLWFLAVVTFVSLGADLWSKAWAMNHFEGVRRGDPRQLVLIQDHLALIYAKNRGGAWGLLQNENESLRRPFFLIVSVVAIVFIVSLYRRLGPGQTALKWGLPLVLGGALGNLVDRVRYGFVVDFIDAYVTWGGEVKHWPTFNVADIAICVGVGLMAIDMFTPRKVRKASLEPTPEPPLATPESGAQPVVPLPGTDTAPPSPSGPP